MPTLYEKRSGVAVPLGTSFPDAAHVKYESSTAKAALDTLNSAVSNIDLRVDAVSGKPQWKERGADTWNPFSGFGTPVSVKIEIMSNNKTQVYGTDCDFMIVSADVTNFTENPFTVSNATLIMEDWAGDSGGRHCVRIYKDVSSSTSIVQARTYATAVVACMDFVDEDEYTPLIPTMTDYSSPSGSVTRSGEGGWNGYTHYAWSMFNGYGGSESDSWGVNGIGSSSTTNWVVYTWESGTKVIPKKIVYRNYFSTPQPGTVSFQFLDSDNNWVTACSESASSLDTGKELAVPTQYQSQYSAFRVLVQGYVSSVAGYICIDSVQVYGEFVS